MQGALEERDDLVALGGFVLLQLQVTGTEDTAASDSALRAPSFFDFFADVRPTDRLRVFAQGRLQTDFTRGQAVDTDGSDLVFQNLAGFVGREAEVLLDQLWVKFDVARVVYVTAGKQRLRWGSGRFFNPTDFVNRQRVNPVALFDQRLGVNLVRLHLPLERENVNLYALADIEGASTVEDVGVALRGEVAWASTETAVTLAYRRGTGYRAGIDVSTGLWRFDVRAEASFTWDDHSPFFALDDGQNPFLARRVDRSDDVIVEAGLGADIVFRLGDDDGQLILGGQAYFNDRGYDDDTLYPFLIFAPVIDQAVVNTGFSTIGVAPPFGGVDIGFNPFLVGRWYAAAFASLIGPGDLDDTTLALSGIGNLSDRSFIVRFDLSQAVLTFLSIRFFTNVYAGETSGGFRLGLDVPPLPDELVPTIPGVPVEVPGLAVLTEGFSIPAPLFDVGSASPSTSDDLPQELPSPSSRDRTRRFRAAQSTNL
ncbi:MAG: hypothetical protein HC923_04005 [Myxococcales bacterium]|nr:hypothetical protein [Myxococcales bacterium]